MVTKMKIDDLHFNRRKRLLVYTRYIGAVITAVVGLNIFLAPTALAFRGGGITPLGFTNYKVIYYGVDAPYKSSGETEMITVNCCDYFATYEYAFPEYPGHIPDVGIHWVNNSGTFLLLTQKFTGASPDLQTRSGLSALLDWSHSFRKDDATGWLSFTVSLSQLRIQGVQPYYGPDPTGAKAYNLSYGEVAGNRGPLLFFHHYMQEEYDNTNNKWLDPIRQGPLTCNYLVDSNDLKEVMCNKYTGYVDLSNVDVGTTFQVHFSVSTLVDSSPAEGNIALKSAYRDPIDNGGGFIIETEGLTPIKDIGTGQFAADRAQAQVIQSDGKIVVAGYAYNGTDYDFALARYNSDGSLDTTNFGSGTGKVTTQFGTGSDQAFAVALQSDGKIVVAGTTRNQSKSDFALARYNSDGSLDETNFGNGTGKVTLSIGSDDAIAYAVAIQPADGKIVVAGVASNGANTDFALARLNSDGTTDKTGFGAGTGMVMTDFGAGDIANALVVQSSGKIVVAGNADMGAATKADFALARYNSDGSLDTTGFGSDGKVTRDFLNGTDTIGAIAIDGQGRIVVAGSAYNGVNTDMALARFDADGNWDSTFGSNGKPTLDFANNHDFGHTLAIQGDNKIVVAGHTNNGANDDFAIARFTVDGALDTSFGSGGKVTVDFQSQNDQAYAVAIQTDQKIVVTGFAETTNSDDFALLRLNP